MEEDTVNYWVKKLDLLPHPEGGYYRETYRSECAVKTERGMRAASTAIYFLLGSHNFSAFHRIQSDELWHFHAGDTVEIFEIMNTGELVVHQLGRENFQCTIKARNWFASKPKNPNTYSLVSCTVAPGFEFDDFEIAKREELMNVYPQHNEIIQELTR